MSLATMTPDAATVPAMQQANGYSLSGRELHVEYSRTSIDGRPRLTYHDTAQTRSFTGDQINVVEVPALGTVVSVTLSIVPDLGSTTFSVLIPTVFVTGMGMSQQVATDAVITMHRMPLIRRLVGQRELYRVVRLTGTAEALVF